MNSPAFGVLGILYSVFMFVVVGLAVYALVLAIIFLRLRIAELKLVTTCYDWSPLRPTPRSVSVYLFILKGKDVELEPRNPGTA